MIIIDDKKYQELLGSFSEMRAEERDIKYIRAHMASAFTHKIFKKWGIELNHDQVTVDYGRKLPETNLVLVTARFKPVLHTVTFLDEPDKIIHLPNENQRFIEINYLCKGEKLFEDSHRVRGTYHPWGYDLERNMQVWKRK